MSIETPEIDVRPEDEQAALDLMEEHPLLKKDGHARQVVENGGMIDGHKIDLGDFLAARAAHLEILNAEDKIAAVRGRNEAAYNAATSVVNSVRPDIERE